MLFHEEWSGQSLNVSTSARQARERAEIGGPAQLVCVGLWWSLPPATTVRRFGTLRFRPGAASPDCRSEAGVAMGTDMQGLSLTGSTEAAVNYDRAMGHLVRFQIEVVEAQASARAADPGCAMAGVFGAYLSLMSTEASSVADAGAALGGVAGDPDGLAPREQAHLAAAAAVVGR